jgi:transcriptional repressor NrdR
VKEMTKVVKRGGKQQSFMPVKIRKSVERAAKDARLAPKRIKELVEEVAEPVIALARQKRVIKAVQLRKSLLGRLERRVKSAARAWRVYERKKK